MLLFALLGIVAVSLGASLAAPPTEQQESPPPPTAPQVGDPSSDPVEISFEAVGRDNDLPKRSIEAGSRVALEVDAAEPGEVSIEGLGRIAAVEPDTPARFDLLLDREGDYEVTFTPVEGDAESVGTLSVEGAEKPEPST